MLFKSRRAQRRALLAVALCAGAIGVVPGAAQASGSNLSLPKVMTRNLYLGADLTPALGALTCTPQPNCALAANLSVWNQVVATNFPERAKRLAKEIDDNDPYIIGLQEVALWRSGPIDLQKNATTVDYDFLQTLLSELSARGTKYKAAVVQQEADIESPAADGKDHRLTMRDVILVRTDLPKLIVSFSNPQSANYCEVDCGPFGPHVITIPTGSSYGDIVFKRGWTAIDIKLLGKPVARFVNTHLESFASGIRQLQAAELVGAFGNGPLLDPNLAAILVGDLNSDPDIPFNGNPASPASDGAAYAAIASAGFVGSGNTTKTFGHNANVNEFPSNVFDERIDHVLTRPGFGQLTNKVVGTDPANRTPGGLWPSDHAGLIVGIG